MINSALRLFCVSLIVLCTTPKGATADFAQDLIRDVTRGIIQNEINRSRNEQKSNRSQSSSRPRPSGQSNTSSAQTRRAAAANQTAVTQRLLNDLGFNAGAVDGVSGRGTRRAISSYQVSRGFQPTGKLSRLQFAGLKADHARHLNPSAGLDLLPAEVRAAQLFLTELGFSTGGADGVWGPNSQRALDAYRRQNGIAVIPGIVPTDLAALSGSVNGIAPRTSNVAANSTPSFSVETPAALDTSDYSHIGGYRVIAESKWLNKYVAMQMLRAAPQLLEDAGNAQSWFNASVLSPDYGEHPQLAQQYLNGNTLEKEDLLKSFTAQASKDYLSVAPISPSNPLKLAVYDPVNFQDFVEGKGLPIRFEPIFQKDWELAHLRTRLRINANAQGTDYLPVTREQAKSWIGRDSDPKRALVQVFWGRITEIGQDATLNSFAMQVDDAFRVPSTFVVERVTLQYQSKDRQESAKVDPEVLYEWRLDDAPKVVAATSGLEFAKNLGLVIKDGHVFPGVTGATHAIKFKANTPVQRGKPYEDRYVIHRLLALTKLSIDPDWAQEGNIFAGLAYLLFDDAKLTSFFGQNAASIRRSPPPRSMIDPHFGLMPLGDEFATLRAKTAFLENELDGVMKQTPVWPMPVLNVAKLNLGEYDVQQQAFPIQNVPEGDFAYRTAMLIGGSDWIASADWIGNLPTTLPMSWERAEQLSRELDGYRTVYLAWTSDLDMSQDGTALENLAPQNFQNNGRIRPGRASLKTIGLYQDPDLTNLILEFDPSSVTTTESVDFEALAAGQELLSLPLMSMQDLFVSAMDSIGSSEALAAVLEQTPEVQSANEFTRDDMRQKAMADFQALPREERPMWIEASVILGEYNTTEGYFRIAQVERFNVDNSLKYRAQMGFELASPLEGMVLPVPLETARAIVEQDGRRLNLRFRSEIAGFRDETKPGDWVSFVATLAPQEMYFYRLDRQDQRVEVVAHINAADEAAKTASATYDVSDFAGLADLSLLYDPHVHDLMRLKYSDHQLTPEGLDGMMQNAARAYAGSTKPLGQAHPGPQFFDNFPSNATKEQRARVLDSFKTWILAKSQAIGTELTVRASLNTPSDCRMGFVRDASRMTRLERFPGLFDGYLVEQDTKALQEKSRSLEGTGKTLYLERGYLSSFGSIDAQTGYCKTGDGLFARGTSQQLFVLEGAPYRTIGVSDAAEMHDIDIHIENVEFMTEKDAEGLHVTGNVVETRWIDRLGNVVNTTPGTPPADQNLIVSAAVAAEQIPPEPTQIAQQEAVAAAPATATAPSPEAPSTPSDTASLVLGDGTTREIRSEYDLIGVKTGMSFDEAEEIIRNEVSITATVATNRVPETPQKMGFIRTLITDDGAQAFSLFGPTEAGPVVAAARVVQNLNGTWPVDAILSNLESKYSQFHETSFDMKSVWWHSKPTMISMACPRLPLTAPDQRFRELGFSGGDPNSINWLDVVLLTPAVPIDNEIDLQNRGECGSFVQFDTPTSALGGATDVFTIFLYDPGVSSVVTVPESEKVELNIKF